LADEQLPFADVQTTAEGFSLPRLKWRELLFIGALRADGDAFVRDPLRPMPPFQIPGLFPEGMRFHATESGDRIRVSPAPPTSGGPSSRQSSL
jgi:hypothetical protein